MKRIERLICRILEIVTCHGSLYGILASAYLATELHLFDKSTFAQIAIATYFALAAQS